MPHVLGVKGWHMHGVRSLRMTGLALSAVVALAGCSSGDGSNPDRDSPRTATAVGAKPLRVVSVAPATLTGTTPIVVTFKHALADDSPLPTITPEMPGQWQRDGQSATFIPAQSYPPSTQFTLTLPQPNGVATTIGQAESDAGSLRFAAQILARLHYLPLDTKAVQPSDEAAEAAAVYLPPAGKFVWRYADTPSALQAAWIPGKENIVLRGAVIAFQHQAHLKQDGAVGPATWKALQLADLAGKMNPDKYSYISANLYVPQRLNVWVDGQTVLSTAVNGGVPAAPTPLGTYPIYLRYTATTMQGTNPDGTKYKDKGVPWVNYFSGGSAVHGFVRASYGTPQSVGCLELPPDVAKKVYDLVDYGTLVTVAGPYVKPPKVAKPAPPKPKHKKHPKPSASPSATESATASPSARPSTKPSKASSPTPKPTRSHRPNS
ncbi:MAG TPA: L,D-transpeptidase family protein [Mycobacteriales bacterium]|nr:L,D-transpeptidase family protein [Mycobacteriales bacterium]